MKHFTVILSVCCVLNTAASLLAAERKPNILVILADDIGYGDLGCYGATKIKTPNIDRLAKEGVRFTDAHSPASVCSPSRYGLLTGQYPFRNPAFSRGVLVWDSPLGIGLQQPTIGTLARTQGYTTGVFGKWHVGIGLPPRAEFNGEINGTPLDVGFDESFTDTGNLGGQIFIENRRVANADPADPFRWETPKGRGRPDLKGGEKARIARKPDCTRIVTGKAVSFVERHKAGPFLLYFAPNNVHVPIIADERFKGKSECGPYGDYVTELDWMVGEVLAALDRNGLTDHTLVLFSSDNGGGYYKPENAKAREFGHVINGRLLGQKTDIWEGGHRVPFIVRWPGRVKAGTQSGALVSLVDVMATLAEILRCPLPGNAGPDSISFLHALAGTVPPAAPRETLVYQGYKEGLLAIRQGPWVLIPAQGSDGTTLKGEHRMMSFAELGLVNSDYTPDGKLKPGAPPGQLYDLSSDLSQATNLYRQHPERVAELTALLEKIKADKQTETDDGRLLNPQDPREKDDGNRNSALRSMKPVGVFTSVEDALGNDAFRPRYHFLPSVGVIHDICGGFYWKGRYHITYLRFSDSYLEKTETYSGAQANLGHASSSDLVHWVYHPDIWRATDDKYGFGTGCSFILKDGTPALLMQQSKPIHGLVLLKATDLDLLETWEWEPTNPVIRKDLGKDIYTLYGTASVWQMGDTFYAVCGNSQPGFARPTEGFLFRSADAIRWTYQGKCLNGESLSSRDSSTGQGEDFACPSLFPLGDKTVITFFSHRLRTQYYIGHLEEDGKFAIEHHDRINWPGGNCHAPRVFIDGKGRRLFFANINEAVINDGLWHQCMTLPVELRLSEDGSHLLFAPADELQMLRYDPMTEETTLLAGEEKLLKNIRGDQVELSVTMRPQEAGVFGLKVRCSGNREEETAILCDRKSGSLTIDMSRSSTLDKSKVLYLAGIQKGDAVKPGNERYRLWNQTAPFTLKDGEDLKLRIFIDKSVLEVFANERRYLVQRIYPVLKDSVGIKVVNQGQGRVAAKVECWKMAPAMN